MNKKHITYGILLLAETIITIYFAIRIFTPLSHYEYDYTQMSAFTDCAQINDKGYYINEESGNGYNGIFTYNPFFNLNRGSYRITVSYDATTSDNTAILSCNRYISYDSLKCDRIILSANKNSVTFNAYLSEDMADVHVITNYGGTGDFTVHSVSIQQTHDMERVTLFKYVFFMLLLDLILLLDHKGFFKKLSREQINIAFLLSSVFIFVSYPLLTNRITTGSDFVFHLLRIEGIKDGLLAGMFPVKIQPTWLEGYGYAVSVFYGDVLLYFPALLRIIGFSIQSAYKIFLFGINIATCLTAYYCLKNILNNRYLAVLGTALYLLAPYRLYGMYLGHTVGECSALIFLPLIVLGLYRIFTMDVKDKHYKNCFLLPMLGYCGLINCHVLTTIMAGVFTIFLCLLCIKRTLRKETLIELVKTVIVTLFVCLGFIIPFLDYYRDEFQVNTTQTTLWIQSFGLQISQLLQMFPSYVTDIASSTDTAFHQLKNTGIAVIFMAGVYVYAYVTSNNEERKKARKISVIFILGITALFMATCYFPWDAFRMFLSPYNLQIIVNSIQDSTRFMQIAILLLIIPGCYAIKILLFQRDSVNTAKNLTWVCIGLMIISSGYYNNYIINTRKENSVYDIQEYVQTHTWSLNEYLPKDTDTGYLTSIGTAAGDGVEISDYNKKYLDITLHAVNSSESNSYIDLPLLYYRGYTADDEYGNVIKAYNGHNNNVLRIDIPSGYSGNIHVYFKEPAYWRLSEIISIISILSLAVYVVYTNKKFKNI